LTTNVVIGTCRVWRGPAQTGTSWPGSNVVSTMLGTSLTGTCTASKAMVRSLAAGGPASGAAMAQDAGSTVLYAGMAGTLDGGGTFAGHLFANFQAGTGGASTVWTDISKSAVSNDIADGGIFNPGGFDISAVVADVHDATGKTVYATVMGFAGNGTNAPHVYRSTNGGTSWTNISSNLPNAPANGLVIDPNDANTLYVAMDTGVYATSEVATCTSANCWSSYGTKLPNSPVTGLVAAAGMATGDGRNGELRAATYGRGVWEIPLLTASNSAAPAITLGVASLTFPAQAVGTISSAQAITVTNSGTAGLTISQIVTTGDFGETDNCVGAVAIGSSCTVQVTFLPAATGTRTGMVTIYGNVAGGQAIAVLTGTGTAAAAIVLEPIAVTFAGTDVGSVSASQNITISNTGGVTATLQTPVVAGDFQIAANTCGLTLAAGVGCTVAIGFKPTASGTRAGSLTITDSAGTQTAALSGLGVLPATDSLTPGALTFGAQQLNTSSAAQAVTLTNSGDAALVLIAAQVTSGNFTVVNGCGNSLNGHSSCSMLVAFDPAVVGPGMGVLTVTDEYRAQTVALTGTGVAPAGVSLSPVSTMTFAATGVGLDAASQTVTLTNNGGVLLVIQSIAESGDFSVVPGSNTCGISLAAGASCSLQITFVPTAAGPRTGTLTMVDSAASSPQSLQLTGTGVDFSLAANGSTAQSITAGGEAVYPLLLSSLASLSGTVTFACAGVPAYSTCLVNPATGALGGSETISVTVATDVALMRPVERPGTHHPAAWLAALLPLGLLGLVRARRRTCLTAVAGCVMMLAGCQASRLIPLTDTTGSGSSTTPTPSGTYNLTVSGMSAGLTRSVGLTLVVQ
jgi:hypothetical protein